MSDAVEAADEPVILGGDEPKGERPLLPFLNSEALGALNLCFLLTTVFGAIAEMLGSPYGAVGCMLVFLGYGFIFRKNVPNTERFADSAYYQGFILTLFALILALTGKGAHTLTSDSIIEKFGLAIYTTFIGMSGRIFIVQFLTNALDENETARQSITEYVVQLNRELGEALVQFQSFRELLVSSASKVSQELADEAKVSRKETGEAVKTAMTSLLKSVVDTGTKLDGAMEKIVERISNLEIPADAVSIEIRKVAAAMGEDLGKVRTELEIQSNSFASTLRENVGILEGAKGELNQLKTSLGAVNRAISDASETTSASLAATLENLAASAEAVRGVEQLGQTSAHLAGKLTALSTALDQRSSSFTADIDRISNETVAAAKEAREGVVQLTGALSEGAQKITKAIQDVRKLDEERK